MWAPLVLSHALQPPHRLAVGAARGAMADGTPATGVRSPSVSPAGPGLFSSPLTRKPMTTTVAPMSDREMRIMTMQETKRINDIMEKQTAMAQRATTRHHSTRTQVHKHTHTSDGILTD